MQRRKFVVGLGSLAAGGAATMGTGAFNFANIERGVNVDVVEDSSAFLALKDTSAYADGSGDQLALNFNENANVIGEGINKDSDYSFTGVFAIRNQGSQSVGVWITDNDSDDVVEWYGTGSNNNPDFTTSIEGSGNPYAIGPGESVYVNVVILLQDDAGSADLPDTINVVADASQGN
jgi:hypothetical protein